jgi:hypothetical protein
MRNHPHNGHASHTKSTISDMTRPNRLPNATMATVMVFGLALAVMLIYKCTHLIITAAR